MRVSRLPIQWFGVFVLAMFLAFEKSMGQSPDFSLKLEQNGLWICSKHSNLGYFEVIESTLQNISVINPAETLYVVVFFSSSCFFTAGYIKC